MSAPERKLDRKLERKLAWRKVLKARTGEQPALRIAVLSTFTAQPAEPFIGMSFEDKLMPATVWTGPYDQILGQCLAPGSETESFRPDVVVIWPRLEDLWSGLPSPLVDPVDGYASAILDLVDAGEQAARRWAAALVFVLPVFPELKPLGVGDAANPMGVTAVAETVRTAARRALADASCLVVDAEESVRRLGLAASLDARLMTTARVPYTETFFDDVAGKIARVVALSRRGAAKVAVVDADNTLWGGVVGEDGADGVDLLDNGPGEAYRAFQQWLLDLRRAGLLIAVASKNNEDDLWPVFDRREMVLRKSDLAAWQVNWDPKSVNLTRLADELNLGLSSFVFIDDNPVEVGSVSDTHPDVVCLQMPQDPSGWQRSIAETGALDRLRPTTDDLRRADGYQVEQTRRELRSTMTPEEYRATLGVEVGLFRPAASDLARLAQLVAKTNQFTLGGPRRTEAELAALIDDPRWAVRLISAKDRFGDYGIVGATLAKLPDAGQTQGALDTFVLSCRAMGRGVEEAMLADAVEIVGGSLAITCIETPKNTPGQTFFASVGASVGTTTIVSGLLWPASVNRSPDD